MNEELLKIWKQEMELGTKCLANQQYEAAEKYFLSSSEMARESRVPEVMAFSLRLLATARLHLEKYMMAKQGFKEALRICEKIKNRKGMSEAWAGLANVAVAKGDFTTARTGLEKAINLYPPSSPPLRLGMLFSDLGHVYGQLQLWEKAEHAYKKAIDLCRTHGYHRGEAELCVLLGEMYYKKADPKGAINQLKIAGRIFAQLREWENMANALQYLAFINFESEKMEESRIDQQRALVLNLRLKSKEENSEGSYFLSRIIQDLGDYCEAEYYLKLSIELYPYEDNGLAVRYQNLGGMAFTKTDFNAAEKHFIKAIQYAHDKEKMQQLCDSLAFAMKKQERIEPMLQYHDHLQKEGFSSDAVALSGFRKLGNMYERKQESLLALQYYWKALELARICDQSQIPVLERIIQKTSQKVRGKKKMRKEVR